MTVREAAARIGCSERLAYKLIAHGELGAVRVGFGHGKLVVSQADVDAYLARCRVEPRVEVKPARPQVVVVEDLVGQWMRDKKQRAAERAARRAGRAS